MHYIIANNSKFNLSKVGERLKEGDTVMHLNTHFGWQKLQQHSISLKCTHEIFFNFKMAGIGPYRQRSDAFSKVYWSCKTEAASTVPDPYRDESISQLIEKGDSKAALKLYFNKESTAVIPVLYTSRAEQKWSVGHKALRYLLRSMEPHCIKLAGFSFHGWGGHRWKAEELFSQDNEIETII